MGLVILRAIGEDEMAVNLLLRCLLFLSLGVCLARAQTNNTIPDPTLLETPGATARSNKVQPAPPAALPVVPAAPPVAAPVPIITAPTAPAALAPAEGALNLGATLLGFGALAGFLLYQCGLTRAKNCAHTCMLLLMGAGFGLAGYWVGGFAVQTGGLGDAHAALTGHPAPAALGALDHELGVMAGGHHLGFMGSSGFFLLSDDTARNAVAALFLAQAVFVVIAIAAALGASLERSRLPAITVLSFLAGAVGYPLVANWVWGGGWLAGLGREFGLGHGVIDLAGAGVVHETAGTLALILAVVLGPRQGRFTRNLVTGIPGHNVPFIVLGVFALVVTLAATAGISGEAVASANVVLGALGGLLASVFWSNWRKRKAAPARLSRGVLAGAVAMCGGGAFFDSWAALVTGAVAALLVEGVRRLLEKRQIDDPVNATAVHGAAGAWGLLAVGFFANGAGGRGLNGVESPARGLFFGGGWHQLAAQLLGVLVIFAAVFALGYLTAKAVQKILGLRVNVNDELQGLDWPQVGALGYQPDVESGEDRWQKLE